MNRENIISSEFFNKLVDILGNPSSVRISYSAFDYGEVQKDVKHVLGMDAIISSDVGYPVTMTINEGSIIAPSHLKKIYQMSVEGSDSVSPVVLLTSNMYLSNDEYIKKLESGNKVVSKAAILLDNIMWSFENEGNLKIVANHYNVALRHEGESDLLNKVNSLLISEDINYQITNYGFGGKEFNKF